MSATCLKTSPVFPSSRFSPPPPPSFFFFPHTRMYCGEKEREREREREGGGRGRPDPLIARHSCPFVRHLIASRGSHGILRGGYLRPPSDLFDRVRVSGTRGSSRRYRPPSRYLLTTIAFLSFASFCQTNYPENRLPISNRPSRNSLQEEFASARIIELPVHVNQPRIFQENAGCRF